jgi:SAM-dependent methyltransferase
MSEQSDVHVRHYSHGDLLARILAGLEALGKPLDALTHEDLAPADEFHSQGRMATKALAGLAEIPRGARVLDVGSGLGGPARYLAAAFGCDVTGVDLTPEFCAVANELSRRVGMDDRTRFRVGDALELPCDDGAFDVVWTIQMQMNVADKARLYREFARALRPGGRFVCQEVCAGNGEPLDYPVPWAAEPAHSHLATPEAMRALILAAGLREMVWRDITEETVAWRKALVAKMHADGAAAGQGPPPLGIHLVLGRNAREKMANSGGNAELGRIRSVQGVFAKPA